MRTPNRDVVRETDHVFAVQAIGFVEFRCNLFTIKAVHLLHPYLKKKISTEVYEKMNDPSNEWHVCNEKKMYIGKVMVHFSFSYRELKGHKHLL